MAKIKVRKISCKKCGASWIPRVSAPKKCPNCQSKKWDKVEVSRPMLVGAYKTKKGR